jgi:hypothetical protein
LLSKQEFYNLNICLKQLVRLSRNGVRHFKTGAVKGPDLVQLFDGRGKMIQCTKYNSKLGNEKG